MLPPSSYPSSCRCELGAGALDPVGEIMGGLRCLELLACRGAAISFPASLAFLASARVSLHRRDQQQQQQQQGTASTAAGARPGPGNGNLGSSNGGGGQDRPSFEQQPPPLLQVCVDDSVLEEMRVSGQQGARLEAVQKEVWEASGGLVRVSLARPFRPASHRQRGGGDGPLPQRASTESRSSNHSIPAREREDNTAQRGQNPPHLLDWALATEAVGERRLEVVSQRR